MSTKGKRKSLDSNNEEKIEKKRKTEEVEESNIEINTQPPEEERNELFVGNLPVSKGLKILKKELKKKFNKYGKISSIRFRSGGFANPKLSKKVNSIKNNFHAERDSINAYIVFDFQNQTEEQIKKSLQDALQENGTLFFDKHIRVDTSGNAGHTNYKRTIFVGNLPLNISDEELRAFFVEGTDCEDEEIENIRVVRDKEYSIGKGFGFVTFKKKEIIQKALKLHGKELKERKLRIFPATKPHKLQEIQQAKKQRENNKLGGDTTDKLPFEGLRATTTTTNKTEKKPSFLKQKKK